MIAGDVSPTHKIILSLFPDPQDWEGIAVGCIDFSLMPESCAAGKPVREKGKGKKRGKGGLR
jgi:hypothetical protein